MNFLGLKPICTGIKWSDSLVSFSFIIESLELKILSSQDKIERFPSICGISLLQDTNLRTQGKLMSPRGRERGEGVRGGKG